MNKGRIIFATSFLLLAAGFLLPWWPLSVAGVMLPAFTKRYFTSVGLGLLLDLAWGAPLGTAHYLYFPFTLLAAVLCGVRFWGGKYFIDKQLPDSLY